MNIKLSKEEAQRFSAMSEPEKQLFMKDKRDELDKLAMKTSILTSLLIDSLDDIEKFSMYRQNLKKRGNMFKAELETYMNDLFKEKTLTDDNEERLNTADFIVHATKAADEELEKVLTILMQ